jgi:hypothetical protein
MPKLSKKWGGLKGYITIDKKYNPKILFSRSKFKFDRTQQSLAYSIHKYYIVKSEIMIDQSICD